MAGNRAARGCRRLVALLALLAASWWAPEASGAIATLELNVTGIPAGGGHARNPLNKASQRKIVRTRVGSPRDAFAYVVYARYNGGTSRTEVILARSRTLFQSDLDKIVLFGQGGAAWSNAVDDFAYPAIEVSADGTQLHVVALNLTQTDVVYTKNVSIATAWSAAWTQAGGGTSPRYDVVSTSAYVTTAPSIAVDENARPHVVWTRPWAASPFASNVYYARHDGASWVADVPLSSITAGSAFPEELDPSIDIANGWVHVLYKDDQDPGDGTAKTDRFRYVRNNTQFDYSGYDAAVTVMQPAAGQNDQGLPGSVAAKDDGVWVTGSLLGATASVGYYNYSSDGGATWALDATGTEDDVYECDGTQKAPAPIGLNSEGSDHRLYAIRRDLSGSIFTYEWGGATWVNGLAGTCASHLAHLAVASASTLANDSLHLSVEKRKPPRTSELVYCWYNSNTLGGPPRTPDTLYCDTAGGVPSALGPRYYHRSIGTRADYGSDAGTCPTCTEGIGSAVTAVVGSRYVVGSGTQWQWANRGPGDVLRVSGINYMVTAVLSDTELVTEQPIQFGGVGLAYSLRRQETRLQDWADCIANFGTCRITTFDPPSASLVADDRVEIGYAYDDTPFLHSTGGTALGQPVVRIDGTATGAQRTITLTAVGPNRHYALAGQGVVVDNEANPAAAIEVRDDHATVEWLEVRGGSGAGAHGVLVDGVAADNDVRLRQNLVHDVGGDGVLIADADARVLAANNVLFDNPRGIHVSAATCSSGTSVVRIYNSSILNNSVSGAGIYGGASCYGTRLVNNVVASAGVLDIDFPDVAPFDATLDIEAGSNSNMSEDALPPGHSPGGNGWYGNLVASTWVDPTSAGAKNLHLLAGAGPVDRGADLGAEIAPLDVDAQFRPAGAAWDMGADEYTATTAVRLMSFSAVPADGSVTLEWRTGSELDNLGFHLHRGPSAGGPWTRLTTSLVPGLGSSPLGQAYSWLDAGLVNGTRYHYRLEDVDTASRSTFHGPASAVPVAAPPPPGGGDGGGDDAERGGGEPGPGSCPAWILSTSLDPVPPACTRHGDPDAVSLSILSRDADGATLELRTGGFWTLRDASGTVRVFVPGLELPADPSVPALPLRRALVEATVGKRARLVSADAWELRSFPGLRPSAVGRAEMSVSRDGTVRPTRRPLPAAALSRGASPHEVARLAGTVFQGETKSVVVEITPVREDGSGRGLVLAGRVRVTLSFAGVAEGEVREGGGGRVPPPRGASREVLAQMHTSRRGLHVVRYEALFPTDPRGLSTTQLRLQRLGEAVAFRVEPPGRVFGPGSVLYFHADRVASSTDYSSEVAYELVRGEGMRMGTASAAPLGPPVASAPTGLSSFETNRVYQPGLLEAPDPWLWDGAVSGATRAQVFTLSGVAASSGEAARLLVSLQGGSDSGTAVDHHVRASVNGADAGEATFAGKKPHALEASIPVSLLREGVNELALTNVGDTGVSSLVFLDRFEVTYPQVPTARHGVFEGTWAESGTVEVSGVSGPPVVLRDAGPDAGVRWVVGFQSSPGSVRFRAEAGRRYMVVSREGLLSPRVGRVPVSTLKQGTNQADHLVIAPREFLEAARPLVERRRGQGLASRAVSLEEIVSEFGHGQPSAEAIRAFLRYAYHSWQRPSPRYVVLLGDATYDPRRFLSTSWASPLPALWTRTSYLWTVSDPALAAVNGEDPLPDLAIGRLPATTAEQAEALVEKLLAWEDAGHDLSGSAILVADNPDLGGDFEANVEDVRASFLADRATTTLKVRELGARTRSAILGALDEGASLASYAGHGGTAVWAGENVLSSWDVPALRAQGRQPLLLTWNCLNGYFVAPNVDSLAEALVKAAGRGALAAFSPSGLSLDGPAHQYHRALVAALASGAHERLGDAVLAAQAAYAGTGLMPELLAVYHLIGDPATSIRR